MQAKGSGWYGIGDVRLRADAPEACGRSSIYEEEARQADPADEF